MGLEKETAVATKEVHNVAVFRAASATLSLLVGGTIANAQTAYYHVATNVALKASSTAT
jgi:hypothetical protein